MRTSYVVLALGMLSLGLCHGRVAAQDKIKPSLTDRVKQVPSPFQVGPSPSDKARNPVPYLSIGDFYARRDPNAVPPRITVAGYYHNYNRQTVSGATFSIDRWNGTGWTSVKNGPLNAILANKDGAESVYLPLSNDAMKFRFVISKSVEGSKVFQLAAVPVAAAVRSKVTAKDKPVPVGPLFTDVTSFTKDGRPKPNPFETGISPDVRAKLPVAVPYLSIDRVYAVRAASGIIVRGMLSNHNFQPVTGATYTFDVWYEKGGIWSPIKTGTLPTVASKDTPSVYAEIGSSFDARKFRLRVTQSVEGSKECALPAQTFVVKYRCPDWQVYRSFEQDSNYLPRHNAYNDLGFATRVEDTFHDNFFSSYHSIKLSYRCVDLQERSFPTPTAARVFQASLPQQGVLTNIVEQ